MNCVRRPAPSAAAHLRAASRIFLALALSVATASAIDTLVPACANEDDPGFTLTVLGSELSDDDHLLWNGLEIDTMFVSETKLVAQVPASFLRNPGVARITLECCPYEGFLTFTIYPDSPAPIVGDDSASVNRNGAVDIAILRNDRDTEGTLDPASVQIQMAPAHGKVEVNSDGTVTYRPAAGFTGTDTFTYTLKDHLCAISEQATVTVTVLDQGGVSCTISPRNAFYPFHRPDELLLFPLPPHSLTVSVNVDGKPAVAPVEVSLSANRDVFPGTSGLPESNMSIVQTGVGGKAQFEVNPVSPDTSRTTEITATGFASAMPFTCRAAILTGGGSLTAPFQGVPDVSKAVQLLVAMETKLIARSDPFGLLTDRKRLSAEVARMVVEEIGTNGASRLIEMTENLGRHGGVMAAILGGETAARDDEFIRDARSLLGFMRSRGGPHIQKLAARAEAILSEQIESASAEAVHGSQPDSADTLKNADLKKSALKEAALKESAEALREKGRELARAFSPRASYGKLPLAFEVNQGQASSEIRYLARGPGCSLYLTAQEAVLVGDARDASGKRRADILRMKLVDSNPAPALAAEEELPGKSHYLVGRDPAGWTAGISHYRKVRYEGVYPGIDLVYYGNPGELEYDFVLAPGADPGQIMVAFQGAEKLRINSEGELTMNLGAGSFHLKKPVAYQQIAGVRRGVEVRYIAEADHSVRFGVADFDRAEPLIIDPVLSYASYLGGANNDVTTGIALDPAGNIYVTGTSSSVNLPLAGGLGRAFSGGAALMSDAFVTKLDPSGTTVIYSTYLGGTGDDAATAIAVDAGGRVYLTGATTSTDFPTFRALQAFAGGNSLLQTDAFAVKLGFSGANFVFSTYLGGSGDDAGRSIAADGAGRVYVVGATNSANFPVAHAIDGTAQGGWDAFVTKIESLGTGLVFSTYLGGSSDESAQGVKLDAGGEIYIVGDTYSADFPTMNPFQEESGGSRDAFVTKLDPAGDDLLFSTYLGGEADDFGAGISIGDAGVYVTGATGSPNFPVINAFQPELAGSDLLGFDAFLTQIDKAGGGITYSTFLGGGGIDFGLGVAVDSSGRAWVVGETDSSDLPTPGALQLLPGGANDGFVAQVSEFGSVLEFSTYFGGSGNDGAVSVALDAEGSVYFTGPSSSIDAPVTVGAFQTENLGQSEGLFAKIVEGESPPAVATIQAASGGLVVAPASIAAGFGDPLATGSEGAAQQPLPTELLGAAVRITDSGGSARLAQLFAVTPNQINFYVDPATALGLALIEVLQDDGVIASGTVQVRAVAPGIFTANASGQGVPAALYLRFRGAEQTAQEFTFNPSQPLGSREPVLIDFGAADESLFVAIFGTGMRGGSVVTATIDGEPVPVSPVVPLEAFVGLDQANVGPIQRAFIGRGVVELRLFVDGLPANVVLLSL